MNTNLLNNHLPFLFAICYLLLPSLSSADTFSLDPTNTFLFTDQDHPGTDAIPIELSTIGFTAGDYVSLSAMGDFDFGPGDDDKERNFIAVFSGSSALLPSSNLNRIVDEIDVGEDFETPRTFFGNNPTDIAEDFLIPHVSLSSPLVIQIPDNASHIFVSVIDPLYEDNSDQDGNLSFSIERTAVPEPNLSMLLFLCAAILIFNARQKLDLKVYVS